MKANIIFILTFFFLVGCQAAGEGESDVLNHVPTVAKFNLSTTQNTTYKESQDINFTLVFPYNVTVTGSPQLNITIGSTSKVATYDSGNGTKNLIFKYTVSSGDTDTDGISVAANINLNGGTLTYRNDQNCSLAMTIPSLSTVKVDTTAPSLTSVSAPSNATYYASQALTFSAIFSEAVVITGTPRIALDIGGTTRYATYASGSGTNTIAFTYVISNSDDDSNGIAVSSPIDLNAGQITDIARNSSSLSFTAPNTSSVLVAGDTTFISTITPPADGTYHVSQHLDFTLTFNQIVNVTGSPRLTITIGSTDRYVTYLSGSGTTALVFRYSIIGGDNDADGISLQNSIGLNGGSITDALASNAILTFSLPTLTGVKVSSPLPSISSISLPSSPPLNGYDVGQQLNFTVNFSEAMTQTGGSSRLKLDISGTTKYANYQSGSGTANLIYRYTVSSNDEDLNGIGIVSPLELNGSNLVNSGGISPSLTFTPPNSSTIKVDAKAPLLISNSKPANGRYSASQNLDFDVTYHEPVIVTGSPRIVMNVGGLTKYANYLSGSGTSALKFRYVVAPGDSDTDGITLSANIDLNSGSIKDLLNHNAALSLATTTTSGILIDTTAPTIISVSPPVNSSYAAGQNLDFVINWSEIVSVTGTPRIAIVIGSNTRYATYVSGNNTPALLFRYTVTISDDDMDGIILISPLELNSGSIKDNASNNSSLTYTLPNTTGVTVAGSNPSISSITPPVIGKYTTGQHVDFDVNFSKEVVVTPPPRIALNLGSGTVFANYVSGGGTSNLLFRYTVAANDYDVDGPEMVSPISLNAGSIQDLSLTQNAVLTYSVPNTSGIIIDGLDPEISSITPPADDSYVIGENLDFVVNLTTNVLVTGTPSLNITIGSTTVSANYISGSGTNALTFRYTVLEGDLDTDGITTLNNLVLNGGTIKDVFGDNASISFTGVNYPNKKVDGVRPTISSLASVTSKTYIIGENIDFTLNYSENITVTGSPRIVLFVGATTRYATYLSGSGSSSLIFRYTVPSGDLDSDGIAITNGNLIDLNSGSITDIAGNDQTNLLFTPPTLTSVNVDAIAPTVTSITSPTSYHGLSSNINFTVNFDEAVIVTGAPTLSINIGGSSKTASYLSGSGTTSLVFRYTTVLNDNDVDGVATVSPLVLASGTMKDLAGNTVTLIFNGATISGVQVDAIPPVVSSVTLPANGNYQNPATLSFTVNFNEEVNVTGSPQISLTYGSASAEATYSSGSGTSSLVFTTPAIPVGSLDLDGIEIANADNISLNGGTIKDLRLNNANLALGANDTSKIFIIFPNIRNWYDISDSSSITESGGVVTALLDKIGTYNLTHSSTGATYSSTGFNGGNEAYITCSTTASFDGNTQTSPKAVVTVMKAPSTGSNSQIFFMASATNRPALIFSSTASSGTVDFGSVNGSNYASGSWGGEAATATGVWSVNQNIARGFTMSTTQNRAFSLCKYDGQLSEFLTFTSQPTPTQMDAIETYINNKYGLSFP